MKVSLFLAYLFCKVDCSAFSDYVNLDLTRIFKLVFNLLNDFTSEKNHLVITNCLRLNHNTNLTACLYSKCAVNTGE